MVNRNEGPMATRNTPIKEYVILVDENNREIGQEEKLKTHEIGALHRAFSVFIFDKNKHMLLQKRAYTKYHSAGLWSNTCCGHPRPGEETIVAAKRRLFEETGIICHLRPAHVFTYRAELSQTNLIEHEIDHVFYGFYNGEPSPNKDEIAQMRWIGNQELSQELLQQPQAFTAWFEQAFKAMQATTLIT